MKSNSLNLGIHTFQTGEGHSAYFVQRSYGNYLVFADDYAGDVSGRHFDFFKSKGGVFRQFLEHPSSLSKIHGALFDRMGAMAVFRQLDENYFHPLLACETFNVDFFDHQIRLLDLKTAVGFLAIQREQKVLILSPGAVFTDNGVLINGINETSFLQKTMEEHGIHWIGFCRYETQSTETGFINAEDFL